MTNHNVQYYIEFKKGMYHIIFEKCHSKILDHYTRFSVTSFKEEQKAWEHMAFLSDQTDTPIKPLY